MEIVKSCVGCVCVVVGSLMMGCGGAAATGASPATAVAPSQVQPSAPEASDPSPSASHEDLFAGSSCGESARPDVQHWQEALLHAIGRDGQYGLFEYVMIDGGVYVGLRYGPLGLSDAEMAAAASVQQQFAGAPVATTSRAERWLGRAWSPASGAPIARAE